MKSIAIVSPSLEAGGSEKVLSLIANYFAEEKSVNVFLILFARKQIFYPLYDKVKVIFIGEGYETAPKTLFYIKILLRLRSIINNIQPDVVLSFGGRYNWLSILSALSLKKRVIIGERSRPGISYGFLLDFLNKLLYPLAYTLVCQTRIAASIYEKKYRLKNIAVIPNPIKRMDCSNQEKKKIILNVGRFIQSKQQAKLINIFNRLNSVDWELWLVGSGPELERCKKIAAQSPNPNAIMFLGNTKNVEQLYCKSAIFAFTSASEGFPNALGEAMAAGCACISFDCNAGPSDLIDHEVSGILVELGNDSDYTSKLKELIEQADKRKFLGLNARERIKKFELSQVLEEFYSVCYQTSKS